MIHRKMRKVWPLGLSSSIAKIKGDGCGAEVYEVLSVTEAVGLDDGFKGRVRDCYTLRLDGCKIQDDMNVLSLAIAQCKPD